MFCYMFSLKFKLLISESLSWHNSCMVAHPPVTPLQTPSLSTNKKLVVVLPRAPVFFFLKVILFLLEYSSFTTAPNTCQDASQLSLKMKPKQQPL